MQHEDIRTTAHAAMTDVLHAKAKEILKRWCEQKDLNTAHQLLQRLSNESLRNREYGVVAAKTSQELLQQIAAEIVNQPQPPPPASSIVELGSPVGTSPSTSRPRVSGPAIKSYQPSKHSNDEYRIEPYQPRKASVNARKMIRKISVYEQTTDFY